MRPPVRNWVRQAQSKPFLALPRHLITRNECRSWAMRPVVHYQNRRKPPHALNTLTKWHTRYGYVFMGGHKMRDVVVSEYNDGLVGF